MRSAAESLTCSACPEGQTTDGTGQTTCSLCVEGYGGNGTSCNICPKGKYRAEDGLKNVTCNSCETGFTTANTGATAAGNCTLCLAGYGGDNCSPCEIGSYSASETALGVNCTACPAGSTTSANTSTTDTACSGEGCIESCWLLAWAGHECVVSMSEVCLDARRLLQLMRCCCAPLLCCLLFVVCLPGYGGASCAQCLVGFYNEGGPKESTLCTACAAGVTTTGNGSTSADACTGTGNVTALLSVGSALSSTMPVLLLQHRNVAQQAS